MLTNLNRFHVRRPITAFVMLLCALCMLEPNAKADILTTSTSSRVLQEALATHDSFGLYDGKHDDGFAFKGGFFSGVASGNAAAVSYLDHVQTPSLNVGHSAELGGDQNVYAVLIDGRYDFNYDRGIETSLHPYLSGGVGMAMYGQNYGGASGSALQSGQMVPLARFGGGVAYQMSESWNLSLDYNAGLTGSNATNVSARGQQPMDMQVVNMGMHFSF